MCSITFNDKQSIRDYDSVFNNGVNRMIEKHFNLFANFLSLYCLHKGYNIGYLGSIENNFQILYFKSI